MAHKRRAVKHRKVSHRRRVGGVGSEVETAGFAIVGAIAGRTVYNILTKVNTTTGKAMLDSKIAAGLVAAAGIALGKFVKSPIGQGAGLGMTAAGGLNLAQSLGVLNGIDSVLNPNRTMVAGYLTNTPNDGKLDFISGMSQSNGMMVGAMVDEC